MSLYYQNTLLRLGEFYTMDSSWNNGDSPPPATETISKAKALLELYEEYSAHHVLSHLEFRAYPLVNGGTKLTVTYYEKQIELDIENDDPDNISVWYSHDIEGEYHEKIIEFKKYRDTSFAFDINWLRDLP